MRIIAGALRSRLLVAPPGAATRPTSDRLRETLFNVLGERVVDSRFADLYAGSGAVGIEALSRGATSCVFLERAPAALAAIRKNVGSLALSDRARVESHPVGRALQELARQAFHFDLVFLDPPYEDAEAYRATLKSLSEAHERLLAEGALVIAEHSRRVPLLGRYGGLVRQRLLEQGDAALSFYEMERSPVPAAT